MCLGPHLLDNNLFGLAFSMSNWSQGGAFVHNLFCGTISKKEVLNRALPYHIPHSARQNLDHAPPERLRAGRRSRALDTRPATLPIGDPHFDDGTRRSHLRLTDGIKEPMSFGVEPVFRLRDTADN